MVVADARLVARRAARGRDPAGEPGAVQRLADVVGRLRGDAQPAEADPLDDLVDARVVVGVGEHAQHRDARRSDAQARGAQALLELDQLHFMGPYPADRFLVQNDSRMVHSPSCVGG